MAAMYFATAFFPDRAADDWIIGLGAVSPLAAAFHVPLTVGERSFDAHAGVCWGYFAFWTVAITGLVAAMIGLFQARWRAAG
jgi:hypothetical protein